MNKQTSNLAEVSNKAREQVKLAESLARQIRETRSKLATMEAARPNPTEISVDDDSAMIKVATRSHALAILPEQIKEFDRKRGEVITGLLKVLDDLKRAIRAAGAAEQAKWAAEIVKALRPYSMPAEMYVMGALEKIDPAAVAAWKMPIVLDIGVAVAISTMPPASPRAHYPETFDRTSLEHADELLSIAQRFFDNGNSFVPRVYQAHR